MNIRLACLLFLVLCCAQPSSARTRHYYIAAEDVVWDYAPSLMDLIPGQSIPDPWAAKTRWNKTRYIEYTDETFSVRKAQPEWLGILGPIIRAEAGDDIVVCATTKTMRARCTCQAGLAREWCRAGVLPITGLPMMTVVRVKAMPVRSYGGITAEPTNLPKPMRVCLAQSSLAPEKRRGLTALLRTWTVSLLPRS